MWAYHLAECPIGILRGGSVVMVEIGKELTEKKKKIRMSFGENGVSGLREWGWKTGL